MDINNMKRDYKFRSEEGAEGGKNLKLLIIICGIAVGLLAFFLS